MSAAFTPGPWHVEEIKEESLPLTYGVCHPGTVCDATTVCNCDNPADANLIAAAPELYEAAERALNYIANTEGELGITLDSGDALRAALAKARGDS